MMPEQMMDEFDRWVIRICKAILVLILLVLYLLAVAWWIEPPPARRVVAQLTPAEKTYFVARYKYHKIWGSECEGARCRFWRDGQWCKL